MIEASLSNAGTAQMAPLLPAYALEDMPGLVKNSFCTMSYRQAAGAPAALTRFQGVGLGVVDVFRHEGIGERIGARRPADIRSHWVDDFIISMPLDAHVSTQQNGYEAQLDPGSFVFLSTTKPFSASLNGGRPSDFCSAYLVRISGPVLRARAPLLDDSCGRPLTLRSGAGRIMKTLFDLALSAGTSLSNAQRPGFDHMLLTAISNVAIEIPEIATGHPRRCRASDRIRQQAISYIDCHLSNPGLGPSQIAEHCGVSPRYLQALFASASTTISAFIREARLQQCRAALKNRALRETSIIEIALRWGFNDAPYFSRSYKARFGKTPSAERV